MHRIMKNFVSRLKLKEIFSPTGERSTWQTSDISLFLLDSVDGKLDIGSRVSLNCKISNVQQILTITLKNILRTFEPQILNIIEIITFSPKRF